VGRVSAEFELVFFVLLFVRRISLRGRVSNLQWQAAIDCPTLLLMDFSVCVVGTLLRAHQAENPQFRPAKFADNPANQGKPDALGLRRIQSPRLEVWNTSLG
jgi:hypothetical protein